MMYSSSYVKLLTLMIAIDVYIDDVLFEL
jgi:hypothetical protein